MDEFHLLIDDLREIEVDHTARNASEGRKALLSFPVTHLYLDHDLGEDSENGYQILEWALERGCCPPNVFLITANPVGSAKMELALLNNGYTRKGNWITKKEQK